MEKVINILIERDGLTRSEAKRLILETRDMIYNCNGNLCEAEDIMLNYLGLELDYLFDIL